MREASIAIALACLGGAVYVARENGGLFGFSYAPLLLMIKGALWILIAAVCDVAAAVRASSREVQK